MAEEGSKASSYPSRQMRQGPAPLASFEDLSDEIESPTEKNSHPTPEIQEKLKLFADAATPTTPHLLATTPSTPRAELSSASTPHVGSQSWGDGQFDTDEGGLSSGSGMPSQIGSRDSILKSSGSRDILPYSEGASGSRPVSQVNGLKNSVSSSFMDDVRGAEAASVLASTLPERSATPECLPSSKPQAKKGSLTSSQLSGQASRTPSRTPSPKSPRRFFAFFKHRDEGSEPGSPSSPKSPRKTSFTNLFKIGRDDHDQGGTSPTSTKKKTPSLSVFFKSGKKSSADSGGSGDAQLSSKGKKDATNRNMFSTLFKKADKKLDRKAPVKLTLQASSVDIPIEIETGWTSREISLHSHLSDLLEDEQIAEKDQSEPPDEDIACGSSGQPVEVQVHAEATDVPVCTPEVVKVNGFAYDDTVDNNNAVASSPPAIVPTDDDATVLQVTKLSGFPSSDDDARERVQAAAEEKISSGSDQESDFDPVSLKKRITSEDYEAETLLDEDMDSDEFPPSNFVPITETQKKLPITPIRRQRHVDLTTFPIERPRSSTPLSIKSLEAYIHTASPPLERSASEVEKLKVSLPGEEFTVRERSPRKVPVKNWRDFCHEVLRSPRAKRKDSDPELPSSSSSSTTASADTPTSTKRTWVTFDNVPEMVKSPRVYRTVPDRPVSLVSTAGLESETQIVEGRSPLPFESLPSPSADINANTAKILFAHDERENLFPKTTCFSSTTQERTVSLATSSTEFSSAFDSSGEVVPSSSVDVECHATNTNIDSVELPEVQKMYATREIGISQPDVVYGDNLCKSSATENLISPDMNNMMAPSAIPDLVTNVIDSTEILKGADRLSKASDISHLTHSSSTSSCSGEVHLHLDSVEGVDPLLDQGSESDINAEDNEELFYPARSEILYPEDDEKRSGGTVVQEMNFIKKKIKGSSKKGLHADDDDLDPAFLPPVRGPEGWVPYEERIDEDSEEWQAFKKLTSRVTETLQKTQDNLTKIVETSTIPAGTCSIPGTGTEEDDIELFDADGKPTKAWLNFVENSSAEDSSDPPSQFATPSKSPSKAPPRPPPPKADGAPPARPPPPKTSGVAKSDDLQDFFSFGNEFISTSVARSRPAVNGTLTTFGKSAGSATSLQEKFNFDSSSKTGASDFNSFLVSDESLINAEDDGDDPFDTSFVDVATSRIINKDNIIIESPVKGSAVTDLDNFFESFGELKSLTTTVPPTTPRGINDNEDEDDPFTYPIDIGTVKANTNGETKMNMFTQYRAKSPNPFLSDANSEPSSINPFLEMLDAQPPPQSDPLDFLGDVPLTGSKNPFASSKPSSDIADLFCVESTTVGSSSSVQQPTQSIDFFASDFGGATQPPPLSVASSNAFDLITSPTTEKTAGANAGPFGSVNGTLNTGVDLFDMSSDIGSKSNHFGANATSQPSTLDLFGGSATNDATKEKKHPFQFFSMPASHSDDHSPMSSTVDLFSSEPRSEPPGADNLSQKSTPEQIESDLFGSSVVHGMGLTNVTSPPSSFLYDGQKSVAQPSCFEHPEATLGSGTQSRGSIPNVDLALFGSESNQLATSDSAEAADQRVATGDYFDGFTSSNEPAVQQPDVFDAFSSVMEPMNAFDGLTAKAPRARIEIPLELVQNADVLEALGQKGPKTPIAPAVFDPPTPVPGEDEEDEISFSMTAEPVKVDDNEATVNNQIAWDQETVDRDNNNDEFDNTVQSSVQITLEVGTPPEPDSDDEEQTVAQPSEVTIEAQEEEEKPVFIPQLDQAAFDAFEARFESVSHTTETHDAFDPFGSMPSSGWQQSEKTTQGFGGMDEFDPFLSMTEPPAPPQPSPAKIPPATKEEEEESDSDDSGPDFSVFIRPKMRDKTEVQESQLGPPPALPPPPKSPARSPTHTSPRFNPFDKFATTFEDALFGEAEPVPEAKPKVPDLPLPDVKEKKEMQREESQESAHSPLFEEDDSEPLQEFPPKYTGDGWELMLRHPNKKKITGQRFWKKVYVRLADHVLQLFNSSDDKDPFQELPLQACYSLSEISTQQFDQYGKIFTVKLQYIFYRERVGVRPGQISKVAHGQITSFGQLAKLGLPLEHAPQVSQLLKLGTQTYNDIKVFAGDVEDALFRLTVHRDRALTYKTEEIQVSVQDETFADVSRTGHVNNQLARVRVFFLAFISGMPDVELGLNDILKKGKEVVGRHDIIPVVTEEWIRLESIEFHASVMQEEFHKNRNIRLHPPDACFFEVLRFRVRPPKNRELPLQVRATITVDGSRVEYRSDILVPGYSGRKHGQIPCHDVAVFFPLPECWIYLFRTEKHFRMGSKKSAPRRPGKIKGLERFIGATTTLDPSLIEVSSGSAKYEHHHKAVVWRVPRLPKEGQGAYTEHMFTCRLNLTSYDQMPDELAKFARVEFTMPATTISHTTVRSISVSNQDPPEKHVRYISKHEYLVEINHISGFAENEYIAATATASTASRKGSAPSSTASSSPP